MINNGGRDQGEYLPFIPPPRLLSALGYEHALKRGVVRSVALKVDMEHCWTQDRFLGLYKTETSTPAYTLFNVQAHADLRYGEKHTVQVLLQVNNLFNTAYQSHLSRLQYFEYYSASPNGRLGIYEMGRNVCLKLVWNVM